VQIAALALQQRGVHPFANQRVGKQVERSFGLHQVLLDQVPIVVGRVFQQVRKERITRRALDALPHQRVARVDERVNTQRGLRLGRFVLSRAVVGLRMQQIVPLTPPVKGIQMPALGVERARPGIDFHRVTIAFERIRQKPAE